MEYPGTIDTSTTNAIPREGGWIVAGPPIPPSRELTLLLDENNRVAAFTTREVAESYLADCCAPLEPEPETYAEHVDHETLKRLVSYNLNGNAEVTI